ncbi:Plectin/S10 domain [Carpediemonas membranifera]|uniref:Plectin/S10 domain n=1 Tax=Carpediemonas membranifera TaxID=201153 RepID=A0A8J6ARE9_9EUKA|nr:Plectin/S10 domain [Carpediemonas membranifera]|eukprot:KAG9390290.1 Plectin/S10 domain [Carpediemonas membranifera]
MGYHIPKANRRTVYEYLIKEGVMVVKADQNLPRHADLKLPNLHVMLIMRSMESRGYVRKQFAWKVQYWFLTDEGINFIRSELNLPEQVVPETMKAKAPAPRAERREFRRDRPRRTDQRQMRS